MGHARNLERQTVNRTDSVVIETWDWQGTQDRHETCPTSPASSRASRGRARQPRFPAHVHAQRSSAQRSPPTTTRETARGISCRSEHLVSHFWVVFTSEAPGTSLGDKALNVTIGPRTRDSRDREDLLTRTCYIAPDWSVVHFRRGSYLNNGRAKLWNESSDRTRLKFCQPSHRREQ